MLQITFIIKTKKKWDGNHQLFPFHMHGSLLLLHQRNMCCTFLEISYKENGSQAEMGLMNQ